MMLATIHTAEGPQLTLDAREAVGTLCRLPASDYAIEFHPAAEEITFMNTPDTDQPQTTTTTEETAKAESAKPVSARNLAASVGAGGFISITSVCGLAHHRRPKKPYTWNNRSRWGR